MAEEPNVMEQPAPREIIAPGSPSEKQDNEIQRRKPFTPQELHRPTES